MILRRAAQVAALLALLSPLVPAPALAAAPAEGLWEGALLPTKGQVASLDEVKVDGPAVSFVFTRFSANAQQEVRSVFHGTLSADGKTIRGEFVEGGKNTYPFVLERKGDAGSERPQPVASGPVLDLSDNGAELKEAFNRAVDKVRLVYLFSPTCPVCRQNARLTERYILDPVKDDRLRMFAVWGPMQKKETAADAKAASVFLTDSRVTQFWTDDNVLANAWKAPLGLAEDPEPAWDTYMLFPPGVRWGDAPPVPSYFMWVEKHLPVETRFNAETLGEQVRRLLTAR
jgi:hypothetical protein